MEEIALLIEIPTRANIHVIEGYGIIEAIDFLLYVIRIMRYPPLG